MNKYILITIVLLSLGCQANKQSQGTEYLTGARIGCGSFTIYALSQDGTEYVSVNYQPGDLKGTTELQVGQSRELRVQWKKFKENASSSLCNDVMTNIRPFSSESAQSGNMKLMISNDELQKFKNNEPYKITVKLTNLVFGENKIDLLTLKEVRVGWLPG